VADAVSRHAWPVSGLARACRRAAMADRVLLVHPNNASAPASPDRLMGARDPIIDRAHASCAFPGDAPTRMPPSVMLPPSIRGYRVHPLPCRRSSLLIFFLLSPANIHDTPFARLKPSMGGASLHYSSAHVILLDAAYRGLCLIAWIQATLHAVAIVPWNRPSHGRSPRPTLLPPLLAWPPSLQTVLS
jgi:hypothetical protein